MLSLLAKNSTNNTTTFTKVMSEKNKFSSALIQNSQLAEVVAPDTKFEVLQTSEGHHLFFSIGTDKVLYLTREVGGDFTRWEKVNLSSILSQFHDGLTVVAKTFAISQKNRNKNVDVALVVTVDGQDYLYLSENNPNFDLDWSQGLNWVNLEFDDANYFFGKMDIFNIYMSQTRSRRFIIVDIIANPNASQKNIFRYYLDPSKLVTGNIWNPHNLPANLQPNQISTCVGRKAKERVGGIYTLIATGTEKKLFYTPLYNSYSYSRISATPVSLVVPNSASSIAVCPAVASGNNYTDIFVAGDCALYYFPYDEQKDGEEGLKVCEHDIFRNLQNLYAHTTDTKVIVWGLNSSQEFFYITCNKTDVRDPSAWSYPITIFNGIKQIKSYVNCLNNGNIFFFLLDDNQLKKAVQSPEITVWKYQDISLPPLYPQDTKKN